jgi:IS5 family transposase
MSICYSGLDRKTQSALIFINVTQQHPLVQLAQTIQWQELANLVTADLQKTPAGKWWLGRKLKLRIHLGVYLLQQLFNKTDRQIEYDVHDNAAYQIFCGYGIVEKWHVPDHTKIEKFRSRLSPETQKRLANYMAFHSGRLGFGDPKDLDIDSTIQEANMAYPADSCLLKKLGLMCYKAAHYLNNRVKGIQEPLVVNMKKIGAKAREYFFLAKRATKEIKDEKLGSLLQAVLKETKSVIRVCENLTPEQIKKMPWNQRRRIRQIKESARQYLKDLKTFLVTGSIVASKRLSFHLKEVSCFTKGKLGKKYQFGRAFQLGRIKGNFFVVSKCTSTQMPDKKSLAPLLKEHQRLFSATPNSVSTDKGYYSRKNENFLAKKGVVEIGIQRPYNIKSQHPRPLTPECQEKLINRRSGIEPLIGHIKHGGQLGRSRMKSDQTIECSGYTAVLGFNMRQLIRYQKGKYRSKVA